MRVSILSSLKKFTYCRSMNKDFNYIPFIERFLRSGYHFVPFGKATYRHHEVILRHDVDFDCTEALKMARWEKELGVQAIYFVFVTKEIYNLSLPENYDAVCHIKELGHEVSIHFDPTIYEEVDKGLLSEVAIFQQLFKDVPRIISFHRPSDFFLSYDNPINGIEHTYMSKYTEQLKYVSDSTGRWRYGTPFETEEFELRKAMHVLIHPLWWTLSGATAQDKIQQMYKIKQQQITNYFQANCKTFAL